MVRGWDQGSRGRNGNVCCTVLSTAFFLNCVFVYAASRLSNAEAPKAIATFVQRQREIFVEEKMRRKEAQDIIHGFREEDGVPPKASPKAGGEQQSAEDALAFVNGYKVAKESILRRMQTFWKDNRNDEDTVEPSLPLIEAVGACAKRWDSSNDELDQLANEMDLISAASRELISAASMDLGDAGSEDSDVELMFFKDGRRTTWTLLWLSLMTMCSTNVIGLVLSLALLHYNLRPGKIPVSHVQ